MNKGKYERGIASLEKPLQLLPFLEVYFSLGLAYKIVSRKREAIESLRRYLELAPPFEEGRKKLVQKILASKEE